MRRLVNINDLRATIIVGKGKQIIKLADSPHYALLKGNPQPYIDYLKQAGQPDHTLEKYQALIDGFSLGVMEDIKCRRLGDTFLILDGFHRACILLYKGIKWIHINIR